MDHESLQAFAAFRLRSGQWSFGQYRNRRRQHQNIRIRNIIDFRGYVTSIVEPKIATSASRNYS